MTPNERGLRTDGAPIKRHDVTVVIRVEGHPTAEASKVVVENAVASCLVEGWGSLADRGMQMLGRPNATRTTVVQEDGNE